MTLVFCLLKNYLEDNKIPLSQLQLLESDGPNVNKTVWNKLNISIHNLHACQYFSESSSSVW